MSARDRYGLQSIDILKCPRVKVHEDSRLDGAQVQEVANRMLCHLCTSSSSNGRNGQNMQNSAQNITRSLRPCQAALISIAATPARDLHLRRWPVYPAPCPGVITDQLFRCTMQSRVSARRGWC